MSGNGGLVSYSVCFRVVRKIYPAFVPFISTAHFVDVNSILNAGEKSAKR